MPLCCENTFFFRLNGYDVPRSETTCLRPELQKSCQRSQNLRRVPMAMEFHDEHYFDVVVRSRQSHRLNKDARGWMEPFYINFSYITSIIEEPFQIARSRVGRKFRCWTSSILSLGSRRCFQGNQIADNPSSEPGIKGATFLHIPCVLCKC